MWEKNTNEKRLYKINVRSFLPCELNNFILPKNVNIVYEGKKCTNSLTESNFQVSQYLWRKIDAA